MEIRSIAILALLVCACGLPRQSAEGECRDTNLTIGFDRECPHPNHEMVVASKQHVICKCRRQESK